MTIINVKNMMSSNSINVKKIGYQIDLLDLNILAIISVLERIWTASRNCLFGSSRAHLGIFLHFQTDKILFFSTLYCCSVQL